MVLKLKLRKVGNSLGVVLPKEALARLHLGEGDILVLSEASDGSFYMTPDKSDFAHQMVAVEKIAQRYRNALHELAQ